MGAPAPIMSSSNHLQIPSPEPSHPPSLHERLVDMNLDALNLLWEGQGEPAVAFLQEGIGLILSNNYNNNNSTAAFSANCPAPLAVPVSLTALELLPGVLGEEDYEPMDHESFQFYRHVFSLEYASDENSQDVTMRNPSSPTTRQAPSFTLQDWDLSTIGAMFLYNLGVVHHENGGNHGNLAALSQAQNLYRYALSLLLSSYSPGQALSVERVHILLALYTNLGHAATFTQDRVTLDVCFSGLEGLLRGASVWLPSGDGLPSWTDFFLQSMDCAQSYQPQYARAA